MRVLVTGGSGFLGRNLVKYLSERTNFEIRSTTFKNDKIKSFNREDIFWSKDLTKEKDIDYVFRRERYDIVFDLASISGGFRFLEENASKVLKENMLMNLNVLDAAVKYGVKKILFASSACVYPAHKVKKHFTEEDAYPIDPENLYGLQKIYMENVYQAYSKKYPIEVYLPRFQGIFGPLVQYKGIKALGLANLLYKIMLLKDGETLEVFGDGTQMRNYLYVDDCIEAMLKLTMSNYHLPMNISYDVSQKVSDSIRDICDILNKKIIVKYTGDNSGVSYRSSSNNLAGKEINWRPSINIKDAYKKVADWIEEDVKI